MIQTTVPCECHGHSHCPKCNGSAKSDIHIITHPTCGHKGCKGVMYPMDHQPGARLKCSICGRTF